MNNIDRQYKELLDHIIHFGVDKKDRTGTGTKSIFGWQIRHKMSEGFPLLTTKKMAWKTMVAELLWFLTGQTNIKFLVDNGCHIWDGDAYKNYCNAYPNVEKTFKYEGSDIEVRKMTKDEFINMIKTDDEFAEKWGELGPIYGFQWRRWSTSKPIDQIDNLVEELKSNPDSRRLMVNAWNVGELDQMVLPPCHYGFQVYTRELSLEERKDILKKNKQSALQLAIAEKSPFEMDGEEIPKSEVIDMLFTTHKIPTRAISLMWNQRSVDTFLGLPFNIASYGLLLEIIAKEVNMVPEELIGNLGDVHLYKNHIEQAKEQITRTPYELPTLKTDAKIDGICCAKIEDFVLENYRSHPSIKAPLSN